MDKLPNGGAAGFPKSSFTHVLNGPRTLRILGLGFVLRRLAQASRQPNLNDMTLSWHQQENRPEKVTSRLM